MCPAQVHFRFLSFSATSVIVLW